MHIHAELQLLTDWLHANPQWGGLAAFLVAFAESLAFVGTIVPGSVTMTAIGVLMGSGVLGIPLTLSLAILGAVVGDSLSYISGYYLKDRLPKMWPFSRYPTLLNMAKKFFAKHGGKSVFLGRFIGPIRAMIPILAGMLHMKPWRFFPIDITAAIFWAPAYLLPGYLIGLAATALPANIATHLLICLFAFLIGVWLFYWLFKKLFLILIQLVDAHVKKVWNVLARSKRLRPLRHLFSDANSPSDHGQLLLIFIFLTSLILFIAMFLVVVLTHHELRLNLFVYHFLRGFRTYFFDQIMIIIAAFSSLIVLIPLSVILFIWLLCLRCWRNALCWAVVVIASLLIAHGCKLIFYSPRPIGIFHVLTSSSFPSTQATVAIACYGYLAWMICFKRTRWKKAFYSITALWLFLIGLSRLYLGQHWLTDILGSFLLGVCVATFAAIIFQRKAAKAPKPIGLIVVTVLTICLSGVLFLSDSYATLLRSTSPVWLQRYASMQIWWEGDLKLVPLYRVNRFGHPGGLLNIQWAGNLLEIRDALRKDGWLQLYGHLPSSTLTTAARNHILSHLHLLLLPELLNDQPPALMMMKPVKENPGHLLLITLWPANITLLPQQMPLWVGSIDYRPPEKHLLFHHGYALVPKDQALVSLEKLLVSQHWDALSFSVNRHPPEMTDEDREKPHYVIMIRPADD